MKMAIGHSDDIDSRDAMTSILEQCLQQLSGETPVAGLLFAGIGYEHELILAAIQDVWPGLPLIGCTTDGEFSTVQGYSNESVVLSLFYGPGIEAGVGLGRNLTSSITEATEKAIAQARGLRTADPAVCLTTPESMTVNCTDIVERLQAALGSASPIVGGVSGDHREFGTTYQFSGSEVLSDSLPILLLWGDVQISFGVSSGWQPIGSTYKVTHSEGNVIYTINDRPVLEVFADYWGKAEDLGLLGEFPLAVFPDPDNHDDFYLRAVFSTDSEAGSATFAATVPNGSTVRMTSVLRAGIIDGSREAMCRASASFRGEPTGALVFSCAARKWLLGTSVAKEFISLVTALDNDKIPLAGFYAFGEIAPLRHGGSAFYHNETCIVVLFGNRWSKPVSRLR
jgi:hypothetical protein